MLPVGWLILAVCLAIVLTMWITFTLTRLDRLHARVDAAQAALDAQLVRRAAALLQVAESADNGVPAARRAQYETLALEALTVVPGERQGAENAVGRAVTEIVESPTPPEADVAEELREAAARVLIARRFYNDAVRDTRTLRARRMPRMLRLAGRRATPQFFDIDDRVPSPAEVPQPGTPESRPESRPPSRPVSRSESDPPRPETAKEPS